jgi:hypothetical protein
MMWFKSFLPIDLCRFAVLVFGFAVNSYFNVVLTHASSTALLQTAGFYTTITSSMHPLSRGSIPPDKWFKPLRHPCRRRRAMCS